MMEIEIVTSMHPICSLRRSSNNETFTFPIFWYLHKLPTFILCIHSYLLHKQFPAKHISMFHAYLHNLNIFVLFVFSLCLMGNQQLKTRITSSWHICIVNRMERFCIIVISVHYGYVVLAPPKRFREFGL